MVASNVDPRALDRLGSGEISAGRRGVPPIIRPSGMVCAEVHSRRRRIAVGSCRLIVKTPEGVTVMKLPRHTNDTVFEERLMRPGHARPGSSRAALLSPTRPSLSPSWSGSFWVCGQPVSATTRARSWPRAPLSSRRFGP